MRLLIKTYMEWTKMKNSRPLRYISTKGGIEQHMTLRNAMSSCTGQTSLYSQNVCSYYEEASRMHETPILGILDMSHMSILFAE